MRLAVFSNLWPPLYMGGYELGAFEVVREFRRRGTEVLVVSAHECFLATEDGTLRNERHSPSDRATIVDAGPCLCVSTRTYLRRRGPALLRDLAAARTAPRACRDALRRFRPDSILAFNPQGIVAPILDALTTFGHQAAIPVLCHVSDSWLANWPLGHPLAGPIARMGESPSRLSRLTAKTISGLLRSLGLLPEPALAVRLYSHCSEYIRRLSRPSAAKDAEHIVAPWGLADARGRPVRSARQLRAGAPLTLVYVGQILPHKGLDVLIRALALCRAKHPLVVIGDDRTGYASECKQLAMSLGVSERIRFLGKATPDEIPGLLAQAGDVAVVPSVWEEPFSLVVLEAAAAGLPVIAADSGGTGEAVAHGTSGLLFAGGDNEELARLIDRLEGDRDLCVRLADSARSQLLRRFVVEVLVDRLESRLDPSIQPARRAAA